MSRAADTVTRYVEVIKGAERFALTGSAPLWLGQTVRCVAERIVSPDGNGETPMPRIPSGTSPREQHAISREATFTGNDRGHRLLWQKYRVVYDMDPDLVEALGTTDEDTLIPAGIMSHLPHPDPFVAFPEPLVIPDVKRNQTISIGGFFVGGLGKWPDVEIYGTRSTHAANAIGDLALLIIGDVLDEAGRPVTLSTTKGPIRDFVSNRITLDVGGADITVGQLLRNSEARWSQGDGSGGYEETVPPVVMKAVASLLYLCTTNAELRPLPAKSPESRPAAGSRGKPLKVVKVGSEIGSALRAWRRSTAIRSAATGDRVVSPHIRRSHFHTYRVGKGRAETRVKWLAPIGVNIGDDGVKQIKRVRVEG
jgi:hypothetical protein